MKPRSLETCIARLLAILILALPATAFAETQLDLTDDWAGFAALAIFVIAYVLVVSEEFTSMRKSKPVMLAAGLIWALVAGIYMTHGDHETVREAIEHYLIEYGELLLFLLVAMTYVNSMTERNVFAALRSWLVRKGFTFRQLFWITGLLSFFLSPMIDNLTTALVMCAVVLAVGADNKRFVSLCCINIVVGANAGGAYSPFGDITTLMVWQHGLVSFWSFFLLFVPSAVNFLVPAAIMHFAMPSGAPNPPKDTVVMKRGARRIILLFALTVTTAVMFHNFLHLPPFFGMMTGLAYLKFFGYYLRKSYDPVREPEYAGNPGDVSPFDSFRQVAQAEWDTLLFFYGVIMAVGGLGFIGYLSLTSHVIYGGMGATTANVLVGMLSAVVDNIPVMVAVLEMHPDMVLGQWLLVTLTAGVGGSLLSVGSAAGVALMGQARGRYTFFQHLRWTPAIALGYAASIWVHMLVNSAAFQR